MLESIKWKWTEFTQKIWLQSSKDNLEENFDDSDIIYFMEILWRNRDTPKLLDFLWNQKWKKDIYKQLYDFLKSQVNKKNNNKLFEYVRDDDMAISLLNKIIDYKKWNLSDMYIYSWDYGNRLFPIYHYINWELKSIPKNIKSLQKYHDDNSSQTIDNGYIYISKNLLRQYDIFHQTQEGKDLRYTADLVSKNLHSLITDTQDFEKNKNKIISLYNSLMIFLYWDNKNWIIDLN